MRLVSGGATLLLLLSGLRSADAQVAWAMDGTGSLVRYGELPQQSSLSGTGTLRYDAALGSLAGLVSYARFSEGGWAASGGLLGSVFTSSRALVRGEAGASAFGRAFTDDVQTGEAYGYGRLHLSGARAGAWAGGGAGHGWDPTAGRSVTTADLGGWIRAGQALIVITATRFWLPDTSDFAEATGTLRWESPRVQVEGVAGYRRRMDGSGGGFASFAGVAHVAGPLHLTVAGGEYLDDPLQGLEGGRYLSAGIRLASRPALPRLSPVLDAAARAVPATGGLDAFAVVRIAPDSVDVSVRAPPGTGAVALLGDLTDWEPRPLALAGDGRWHLVLAAPPGRTRLSFRVDGTRWVVPAGVRWEPDDFGGAIAVVAVP